MELGTYPDCPEQGDAGNGMAFLIEKETAF